MLGRELRGYFNVFATSWGVATVDFELFTFLNIHEPHLSCF